MRARRSSGPLYASRREGKQRKGHGKRVVCGDELYQGAVACRDRRGHGDSTVGQVRQQFQFIARPIGVLLSLFAVEARNERRFVRCYLERLIAVATFANER